MYLLAVEYFQKGSGMLLTVAPLRLLNRIIIRAHIAPLHESLFIKFPMFIPMCPHPLSRVRVTPFVLETHRDAVVGVTPQLFHQPIVQFLGPFSTAKRFDRLSTRNDPPPLPPFRIRAATQRDPLPL